MMNGFETGKYHGLLWWSPDRLSRNMLEGGQIIEHVDHEKIQDLLFCTYAFDNTPNGKMMLGILFATSKQCSDKLAVDVARVSRVPFVRASILEWSRKGIMPIPTRVGLCQMAFTGSCYVER